MKQTFVVSAAFALLIGIVQMYLLTFSWAYIAIYSPLTHWLIELGLRGFAFRAVLFPLDFVTNVLLCLPAAFVIYKLRPRHLLAYLAVAVLPVFLWQNRILLGDATFVQSWALYAPGWVYELLPLPVAALIIRTLTTRQEPNNSFKPNPLRSSSAP
jgi:hypothetical protein